MATENINGLFDHLAVKTGAGDGIGKAISIKLATEGCNIALVDINQAKVTTVTQNLKSLFPAQTFHSFICDASSELAINQLVDSIKITCNTDSIQLLSIPKLLRFGCIIIV